MRKRQTFSWSTDGSSSEPDNLTSGDEHSPDRVDYDVQPAGGEGEEVTNIGASSSGAADSSISVAAAEPQLARRVSATSSDDEDDTSANETMSDTATSDVDDGENDVESISAKEAAARTKKYYRFRKHLGLLHGVTPAVPEHEEDVLFCAIVEPEGLHDEDYYENAPELFNPFRVADAIKREKHDRYFLQHKSELKPAEAVELEKSKVHAEAWIDLKVWKDLKDYTDYFINVVRPQHWKRMGTAKFDGEAIAVGSMRKTRFLRVAKDYFFPRWNLDCRTWAHMIGLGEVSTKKCKVVGADGKTHVDFKRWMAGRAEGMLVHKNPKLAAM